MSLPGRALMSRIFVAFLEKHHFRGAVGASLSLQPWVTFPCVGG